MHSTRSAFLPLAAVATVVSATLALTACAGQSPGASPSGEPTSSDGPTVGLLVSNAFGDHSYFDAAALAIEPMETDYGAVVTTYEAKLDQQSFAPLLQDAADANEIVFVVGAETVDATIAAAQDNPDTTFVVVNSVAPSDDVVSVVFRNAEGCYMSGAAAAVVNSAAGRDTVGFMGGFNAPVVLDCEAGYAQGVTDENPDLKLVSQFVGSFSDPNKGFEVAGALAQQGAYAIYSFAGLSGQGAVKAAESGADIALITADVPDLGTTVAAAVQAHTETLLIDALQQYLADTIVRGEIYSFGFAEGAYDIAFNEKFLDEDQKAALEAIRDRIISGEIVPAGTAG